MENKDTVCIIGLGFVGLTLAITLCDVGVNVFGIESNEATYKSLSASIPHFYEPKLEILLRKALESGKLTIKQELPHGLTASIYIVTVGTPLNEFGRARLDIVELATHQIAESAPSQSLVILRSTCKLGTTSKIVKPILNSSGKHFDLAFCPERTVEGQALQELRYLPQIIGGVDSIATNRSVELFTKITPNIVNVSSPEVAEMIKMVDNTYRDICFGFSNEVAMACDLNGINAHEVIMSGRDGYKRSNHLYMPGPVGGPCLSKDPHIFSQCFEDSQFSLDITKAARTTNEFVPSFTIDIISKYFTKVGLSDFANSPLKISILGLAFKGKPETNDLRGSTSLLFIETFKQTFSNATLFAHDPMVTKEQVKDLGVVYTTSIDEAFAGAHLVLIANNHPLYSTLPLDVLSSKMKFRALIYDLWAHYTSIGLDLKNDTVYSSFGNSTL